MCMFSTGLVSRKKNNYIGSGCVCFHISFRYIGPEDYIVVDGRSRSCSRFTGYRLGAANTKNVKLVHEYLSTEYEHKPYAVTPSSMAIGFVNDIDFGLYGFCSFS